MAERRVYICSHKDCIPPTRVFLSPGEAVPRCHGRAMQPQANVPYLAGKGSGPKRVKAPEPR